MLIDITVAVLQEGQETGRTGNEARAGRERTPGHPRSAVPAAGDHRSSVAVA